MINAGRLRERVILQNPPAVDDGSGGQTGGWTDVAWLRAEVVAVGGDEEADTAILTGVTRYRVRIRRRVIATGQRLLWGTQALNIRNVLPDTGRMITTLLCEAVQL